MLRQLVLRSMWNFPVRIKVRIPSSDLLSTAERSLNGLGELDHSWELSHREILYLMRYLWDSVHVWTCFWKRCHSTLVEEALDVSKYLLVLQSLSVKLHVWDVFRAITDKYKADDSAVLFFDVGIKSQICHLAQHFTRSNTTEDEWIPCCWQVYGV